MAEPYRFTAQTNILEALELDPEKVGGAFRKLGLKCIHPRTGEWCAATVAETLAEASLYHEVPLETILVELNALGIVPKNKK